MVKIKQTLTGNSISSGGGNSIAVPFWDYQPEDIITVPTAVTKSIESDYLVKTSTPNTYYIGGRLFVKNTLEPNPEIISLTPSVATISNNEIQRVSSGVANFQTTANGITIQKLIDLTDKIDGQVVNEFQSTIDGVLSTHLSYEVDSRINSDMTMNDNGKVFTTQDHSSQSYVRNENLWLGDVDITCASPWNSNSSNRKAGTLITPRHILNAAHYEYSVGTVVRFVTNDNVVVDRTIVGKKRHPNYRPYSPDLTIYTLNEDLPTSITPCEVLPENYEDYIPLNFLYRKLPASFGLDQEEKALIQSFVGGGRTSGNNDVDVDRNIFYESKIVGDSGNPAFIIVNGKPIIFTVWTYGGSGSGTDIADHISALNQMIVDADTQAGVSTGYTVTEADFSDWPNITTQNYVIEDNDIANDNASFWVDVNGDGSVYRKYTTLSIYEEANKSGGTWQIIDQDSSVIATSAESGLITDATFTNSYSFSNPS
jgi:hypothetical protein